MINAFAIDYNLALNNYDQDVFEHFFTLINKEITNTNFDFDLVEFLKQFLAETQTNSEYISNLLLFRRALDKNHLESESLEIANFLQSCSAKFINNVFHKENINPNFAHLIDIADSKFIYKTLVIEPYFNEQIGDRLLQNLTISPDKIDYITTNEFTHYGKKNIRFYFELLDKMHLQSGPASLLYITNDKNSALLAAKLGITIFFITETTVEGFKYQGNFSRLIDFITKLPKAIFCQM